MIGLICVSGKVFDGVPEDLQDFAREGEEVLEPIVKVVEDLTTFWGSIHHCYSVYLQFI